MLQLECDGVIAGLGIHDQTSTVQLEACFDVIRKLTYNLVDLQAADLQAIMAKECVVHQSRMHSFNGFAQK